MGLRKADVEVRIHSGLLQGSSSVLGACHTKHLLGHVDLREGYPRVNSVCLVVWKKPPAGFGEEQY